MLLRRVIEHVREQNLTAIAIDFVIVVVGVFVGIQVSNWNAERADRERGAQFAERLRADLRQERWLYDFMLAYHSDVRDSARAATAAMEGRAPLSNHDLLVEAYRATQYREGARRRATYDERVSTGSLGLIADQRMLGAAAQFYRIRTIDNLVSESLQSPYRREFRMSVDSEVQRRGFPPGVGDGARSDVRGMARRSRVQGARGTDAQPRPSRACQGGCGRAASALTRKAWRSAPPGLSFFALLVMERGGPAPIRR